MCATVWRHLVKAADVTAGLAKSRSNGSLPPGVCLKVICSYCLYVGSAQDVGVGVSAVECELK